MHYAYESPHRNRSTRVCVCLKVQRNSSTNKKFETFQVRSEISIMSQASKSGTRVGFMTFVFLKIAQRLKCCSLFQSTSAGATSSSGLGFLRNLRRGRGTAEVTQNACSGRIKLLHMQHMEDVFIILLTFFQAVLSVQLLLCGEIVMQRQNKTSFITLIYLSIKLKQIRGKQQLSLKGYNWKNQVKLNQVCLFCWFSDGYNISSTSGGSNRYSNT